MTWIKSHRSKIVFALISALALTASFPRIDQGWLAWVALVPFFLAVRQADGKSGFLLGFGFGFVHYLGLVYWTVHTMHFYGNLPVLQAVTILLLLSAYLALFPGAFGAILAWLGPKPRYMVIVAPALWVGLEMSQSWLFTGFPWELLGYSQHRYVWVIQMADLFGVYGLSAVIVFANAVLALVGLYWLNLPWQKTVPERKTAAIAGTFLAGLVIAVLVYGVVRVSAIDQTVAASRPVKVAVIQGNIDQAQKWDSRFQMLTTVKYRNLSLQPSVSDAELVIWPETATPFYLVHDKILSQMVIEGIQTANAYFIIGSPSYAAGKEALIYHNSAYLLSPQGEVKGKYDKVHLVPFGEYVPLKRWLPFIDKMVAQVGDFKPGRPGSTLDWEDHPVGMLICYEAIFPELARAMVRNGAQLLVNITNDAWFGRTSAAYQHFSMAAFRAVENRRYLARAANTGFSGFVDPCGRIVASTQLFQDATVNQAVTLLDIATPYNRWGQWPLGLLTLFVVGVAVARKRLLK